MNKKSYFRGIGAGLIVAAVIMGAASGKNRMSDEEILKRAQEIQNNQSVVLTEAGKDGKTEVSSTDSEIIKEIPVTDTSESEISPVVSTETSIEDTDNNAETDEDNKKTEEIKQESVNSSDNNSEATDNGQIQNTEKADDTEEKGEPSGELKDPKKIDPMPDGENGYTVEGETVELVIIRGDSSVSVSRRMQEAGLIESAAEFDKYLCSNGYDKSISVGTYQISYGLEFEEMAKIISRRR